MYCPKCGSENSDEVIYCRACGVDLAIVRGALEDPQRGIAGASGYLSDRQLRRMRRRGLDGTETPLTLATRAIELQASGVRGLMLAALFAFFTAFLYTTPPIGGIFWLLPLIPTAGFLAASLSRFLHAGMIKKLIRPSHQASSLPDAQPDYLQPPRSIYETDELAQPSSVIDATTRHLR
jgi:hypothetical protein